MHTSNGRQKLPVPRWLKKTAGTAVTVAVTLLGLLFVTFMIGRVMPIDPVLAVIGERATAQQQRHHRQWHHRRRRRCHSSILPFSRGNESGALAGFNGEVVSSSSGVPWLAMCALALVVFARALLL